MNIKDITITSIETITAFDMTTGAYKFTLDELQNATISQSEEKTDITGKNGRKLSTIKRNKSVSVSGTNCLVSHGLLEMQTGSEFATTTTEVLWIDAGLVVDASHKSATTYKAVGTAGAEITALFIRNSDGTLGAQLTQDSTASAGKFAYDPATKELSFHTDVPEKTEIVAYYNRKINADVLKNESAKYSERCALYIDAMGEDACSNVVRVQFYLPKADFSGEFSLEMGENQTMHEFTIDALSGACGASGYYFTYTVFGADEADA